MPRDGAGADHGRGARPPHRYPGVNDKAGFDRIVAVRPDRERRQGVRGAPVPASLQNRCCAVDSRTDKVEGIRSPQLAPHFSMTLSASELGWGANPPLRVRACGRVESAYYALCSLLTARSHLSVLRVATSATRRQISPGKSSHLPAYARHIYFRALRAGTGLRVFRPLIQRGCLLCGSCSSGQRFVSGFLQIPPHDDILAFDITVPPAAPVEDLACSAHAAPPGESPCRAHHPELARQRCQASQCSSRPETDQISHFALLRLFHETGPKIGTIRKIFRLCPRVRCAVVGALDAGPRYHYLVADAGRRIGEP